MTTTAGDEIPKCAFVDPPSIQLGERLPFWWEVEDDAEVTTVSTCDASSAGHINKDTLQCHFTILAPDGKTVALTRSCAEDDLKDAAWYYDLQQDLQTTLAPSR